jgi:EAL domain-containing protein (putative c-di-GMP-specific phosphodiesterase class I)
LALFIRTCHGVDFANGYFCLSYPKRLQMDQLKIERACIRDVLIDANNAAIARTIETLAPSLGLSVTAEGLEPNAQRNFLAAGCHAYQGYFLVDHCQFGSL